MSLEESILTSVKSLLGIQEDYENFDGDIIMHINAAFATLHQLGVGPKEGFEIHSANDTWSDFVSNVSMLSMVKTYLFNKVRIGFDPPTSSFVLESTNRQIAEAEWRLLAAAETPSLQ